MIEVVNRQRSRLIDLEHWQRFATRALQAIGKKNAQVTIAFVSNRRIQELNKRYRGINKPTDVLSFPAGPDQYSPAEGPELGDVAVSVERADEQARENRLSFDDEIAQLILHGLLHLCGYDHETDNGEMDRLELRLRRRLGL